MTKHKSYPCPCCGYLVLDEPGSYDICPICFWEDDISQLRFVRTTGANHVSLIEGQQNYITFGACEEHCKLHVRRPAPDEVRDPEWRVVNPDIDNIEDSTKMSYKTSYPDDSSQLYYWRPTYWRRTLPK